MTPSSLHFTPQVSVTSLNMCLHPLRSLRSLLLNSDSRGTSLQLGTVGDYHILKNKKKILLTQVLHRGGGGAERVGKCVQFLTLNC